MNVNWDDEIPNILENKKCSKPPTRLTMGLHQNVGLLQCTITNLNSSAIKGDDFPVSTPSSMVRENSEVVIIYPET